MSLTAHAQGSLATDTGSAVPRQRLLRRLQIGVRPSQGIWLAGRDRLSNHMEVSQRGAEGRQQRRRVLQCGADQQLPAGAAPTPPHDLLIISAVWNVWRVVLMLSDGIWQTGFFAKVSAICVGGHRHKDAAHWEEHALAHHLQGHLCRQLPQLLPRPRAGALSRPFRHMPEAISAPCPRCVFLGMRIRGSPL